MAVTKVYTIADVRPIRCLGGIVGPIKEPIPIKESDILEMLRQKYTIYQHNPFKKSEKVLVTRSNFKNIRFTVGAGDAYKEKQLQKELIDEAKKPSEPVKSSKKKDKDKEEVIEKEIEAVPINTNMDFTK